MAARRPHLRRLFGLVRALVLATIAVPVVLLVAAYAGGVRLNVTSSMPLGLYQQVDSRVERGALVSGCLPDSLARFGQARGYLPVGGTCTHGVASPGVPPVLKLVVGVPGDAYRVTEQGVEVAGRLVAAPPLRRDRAGRPLASAGVGVVPAGEWFVIGASRDSWDSRYYGPLRLVGGVRLRPLLVFPHNDDNH